MSRGCACPGIPATADVEQGCRCHCCGGRFRVDLLIPDELWAQIGMPTDGAGLLCGSCIMRKVEGLARSADGFGYLHADGSVAS